MSKVLVKKLNDTASLPTMGNPGDAGWDIRACLDGPITLRPMERAAIPTGLSFAIPEHLFMRVWARSGLAVKFGITELCGVVDPLYRGELKIVLINLGQSDFVIYHGDRIAQAVYLLNLNLPGLVDDNGAAVEIHHVETEDELPPTIRGEGGFGSSGTK